MKVFQIVANDDRLIDLLTISVDTKALTLWKIFLDCIFECSQSINIEISIESLRCIEAFVSFCERSFAILFASLRNFLRIGVVDFLIAIFLFLLKKKKMESINEIANNHLCYLRAQNFSSYFFHFHFFVQSKIDI